ncbi:MAG: GNAT family N-acetyltransferase [Thiohalobacterales bacterium]|nr:GNAT family N-acetyltransferase [Thiohalobacterales bacterium]
MVEALRYTRDDRDRWDELVTGARNGHFMFMRDYMDYHADRFEDHSLLFERDGRLLAVMPANRDGQSLHSHGGLTFGGIISGPDMTTAKMLDVFAALQAGCRQWGIARLVYKAIPHIYHHSPAGEDLYALQANAARLIRRDLTSTLEQSHRPGYSGRQKRNIGKGRKAGLAVTESTDFGRFWELLTDVLAGRHGVAPVHSLGEIRQLAERFPGNIRLFEACTPDGELLAGTVLYINEPVVHTQYLANSEAGRKTGALDYLIDSLIERYRDIPYFDFGISTVNQGRDLNEGLCTQKEGFGARAIVHDFYEMDIR